MFLHEPGEDNDSFTRQDLSMMNSIQTQQPSQSPSSRAAPPAHPGPPVAAAIPMSRQDSNDTSSSSHDAPGLPATASWGSKAVLERRASRSTIASNSSPLVTNAIPAQTAKAAKAEEPAKKKAKEKEKKEDKEKEKEKGKEKSAQTSKSASPQRAPEPAPVTRAPVVSDDVLGSLLKTICSPDFKFVFSSASFTEEEFKAITEFPQLLDPNGGAKRRAMREKEKELALQREAETEVQAPSQPAPATEREESEATAGGSLQLGGEPEEGENEAGHLGRHAIAPPGQQGFGSNLFGQNNTLNEDFSSLGLSNRGLTTQQQHLLLSNFKSNSQSTGPISASQNLQAQQHGMTANAPGHSRQTSRFSFANDSASASANVQPVANQKLMSQQNSMMPKNTNHFGQIPQHQALGNQFFTNVQGPPPGLKPTGTPPVGGTSMFGQGHGFATGGLGYGANAGVRNNSDAMYQDLLRSRNMDSARAADAGKRESMFPSFLNQHSGASTPAPAPGLLPFPYGPSPGAYQDSGSQKSKKKGKKHRHANTSSSGGGGLADVQDPSILQARLHQSGMAGQGMYGQAQSGFSSLYANNNYGGAGRW
jgi:CCR4-NOT transcription complex subunit 4